jgi:hypothetical protein
MSLLNTWRDGKQRKTFIWKEKKGNKITVIQKLSTRANRMTKSNQAQATETGPNRHCAHPGQYGIHAAFS